MKAWSLHGIGNISLDEVPIPEISDNEALVKVKSAGICGSDIPRIYKTGAYHHPLIPGHEFSGQVVKCGKNSEHWNNKRVGIFPLIPCGKCIPCQNKQYEMCRNYSYLGSRRDGGFAEYVAVPADNLIELPENVNFEEAAMLEPMSVAIHSIRRISPKKNDKVVVCGLGTIGLFIVMFLKEMGIENIFVIGNKEFQRQKALELGISDDNYFNSKDGKISDWINKQLDSADIFFECVGKNETVYEAVNSTAPAGKIMLLGNPYADMQLDKAVYWKILRNQLTLLGTWNSSFTHECSDDWHYVLQKLAEKKINPSIFISHRFPLEQLESGFLIMKDKSADYVKIIAQ